MSAVPPDPPEDPPEKPAEPEEPSQLEVVEVRNMQRNQHIEYHLKRWQRLSAESERECGIPSTSHGLLPSVPEEIMLTIKIVRGDLTKYKCDMIVNAANKDLAAGGGLDGCIRTAAGSELTTCTKAIMAKRNNRPLDNGEIISTQSFKMKNICKHITHAAAPDLRPRNGVPNNADEISLVVSYSQCIGRARQAKLKSVGYPILGGAIFRYPMKHSFMIGVLTTMNEWIHFEENSVEEVSFVMLSQEHFQECCQLIGGRTQIQMTREQVQEEKDNLINDYWPNQAIKTRSYRNNGITNSLPTFYDQVEGGLSTRQPFSARRPSTGTSAVPKTSLIKSIKKIFTPKSAKDRINEGASTSQATEPTTSAPSSCAYKVATKESEPFTSSLPGPSTAPMTPKTPIKRPMMDSPSPEPGLFRTPSKRQSKVQLTPEEKSARHREAQKAYREKKKALSRSPSVVSMEDITEQARQLAAELIAPRQPKVETRETSPASSTSSRRTVMTPEERRLRKNELARQARAKKSASKAGASQQSPTDIMTPIPPLSPFSSRGSSPAPSTVASTSQSTRSAEKQRRYRERQQNTANANRTLFQDETINDEAVLLAHQIMAAVSARSQDDTTRNNVEVLSAHIAEEALPEKHFLGLFNVVCPFCHGRSFPGKRNCCNNGKIWIEPFKELPEPILSLLNSGNRKFLDTIVKINSLLAMASNQYTRQPVEPNGVQATKILGQVNHFPSAARVNPGGKEGFGNFYAYDIDEATNRRMNSDYAAGIDKDLLKELTRTLHRTHPLAQSYQMMHEVLKREARLGRDAGRMKMRIVTAHDAKDMDVELLQHDGTYSVPAGKNFVCVFFTCSASQVVLPRGLTVYEKRGNHNSAEIKFYTKVVDSLCYPTMFPYGEGLWEACRLPMQTEIKRYLDKIEEIRLRDEVVQDGEEQAGHNQEESDEYDEDDISAAPRRNRSRDDRINDIDEEIAAEVGDDMDGLIELTAGASEQPAFERPIRMVERGGEVYPERVQIAQEIPLNEGYMSDDSGPVEGEDDEFVDQLVRLRDQMGEPTEEEYGDMYEEHLRHQQEEAEQAVKQYAEFIAQYPLERSAEEQYEEMIEQLNDVMDQQDRDRGEEQGGDRNIRPVDPEDNEDFDAEFPDSMHYGGRTVQQTADSDDERPIQYVEGEEQQESDEDDENRPVRRSRGFISIREAALFFNRYMKDGKSRIAHFRKLGQLYLIDVDTRIIHQRMQHIQKNFTQTLTSTKQKLVTCLQNNIDRNNYKVKVGSVTSVPAHIPGSPRYMRQKFEEAVALANTKGHPDMFITFTGNKDWQEIKDSIPRGDDFADHPMIVAEVFHKKMMAFLDDVLGKKDTHDSSRRRPGIFGEVSWFVYSVEFQQRGMPHIHLILSLKTHIRTASDIDKFVWARIPELPEPNHPTFAKMEELRKLVIEKMTHTPCEGCGVAYCNVNKPPHWKKCTKRFPKEYNTETQFGDQSYPDYFRPNNGDFVNKKRKDGVWAECNNTYVVPYNPTLLLKYQSHINVEVISSIKVVKYLFKYIFKGYDRTIVEAFERFSTGGAAAGISGKMTQTGHILHREGLTPDQIAERNRMAAWLLRDQGVPLTHVDPETGDRIQTLVYDETAFIEDMRAITSCEAAWDIAAYLRCVTSHSVVTLYVHAPEEEPVQYVPGAEEQVLANIEQNDVMSRLKAWFVLNAKDGAAGDRARTLTYDQLPKYFTYTNKKWAMRRNDWSNKFLGRVKSVQPRYMEQFAIRLLALNQKGPTSFEELRTVDEIIHPTFVDAAKALRLMNDEMEWDYALREAATLSTPTNIRRMFVSILIFCAPANPLQLWTDHMENMFAPPTNWTVDAKIAHALHHIESGLLAHDMTLAKYGLPEVNQAHLDTIQRANWINDNDDIDVGVDTHDQRAEDMFNTMNAEQKSAIRKIMASSSQAGHRSRCFFIEGAGGTGKTYVYKYLYHKLRSEGKKVLCVAHTGIAATLLPNGCTAHRAFGLPIQVDDDMKSNLDASSYQGQYLSDVDAIIWDEAPMSDRRIYGAVDNFLRLITGKNMFMGGILTVFGGDWRQTLPILDDQPESAIPGYTMKNSDMWQATKQLKLTTNMRAQNDPAFCEFLIKVGNGEGNDNNSQIKLPQEIMKGTEESVIDWIYPLDQMNNYDEMSQKMLLTVDNRTAHELNEKILDRMTDPTVKTYLSMDTTDKAKGFHAMDPEIYKSMTPSGMPPHELRLKKNCQVILLRNQNVKLGLCNGTRLRVLEMGEDTILCQPVNGGDFTPNHVLIHRMDMTPARAPSKEFAFIRHQFPLRLAFAMTINKSQGQTLGKVGVILRTPCFAHGQLYVALSRVRCKNDIRVYNSKKDINGNNYMVTNRVLDAVFRN